MRSSVFRDSVFENANGGVRTVFGARSCVRGGCNPFSGAFGNARSRMCIRLPILQLRVY